MEIPLQVSPTRFRVPDVMVWSRDYPREQIIRLPPPTVFEVLSPEDLISRVLVKLEDCARMGIGTIRVIDPARDLIYGYFEGRLEPITEEIEAMPRSLCHLNWTRIRTMLAD